MFKWVFFVGAVLRLGAAAISAQGAAPIVDPVKQWELDYETGIFWRFTGSATPLSYLLVPQFLTVKTPAAFDWPVGGGDLVLRHRLSLLLEPIVHGPEHHYFGFAASGILEWWDRARTGNLFFSAGGGFGELDSRGYQIAGAQGQEFNFNWFAYPGARVRWGENWSVAAGVYFQHVSNGHLDKVDPGLNTLGPILSVGRRF